LLDETYSGIVNDAVPAKDKIMDETLDRSPFGHSPESSAAWCAEIERDYGALVPPLAAHSPAPELLAAAWLMLRATMVTPGLVDRTTKEAVAAAVAHANGCRSREELHVTVLESLNERRSVDSEVTSLADHRIRQITAWARRPGGPRPFDDRHVAELLGTVVVSHYLDRIAIVLSVADTDRGGQVARHAHRVPAAGTDMLPDAPPAGFDWAAGRPDVASAFARAAAVVDAAGARSVPAPVRALVLARLADWQGEAPWADRQSWLAGSLGAVPDDDRLAARLALLTAVAPAQVDPSLVSAWRERAGERQLVELVGWAGFAAARRIGQWLAPGRPTTVPAAESHRVLQFRPTTRRRTATRFRERRAGV
jgi:hypothetical protein